MARARSEAFGAALKALREERGLSQEAAAQAVGLDRAHYGKLERAAKVPTLTTIWKLADGLDTTPSELLARAEHMVGSG